MAFTASMRPTLFSVLNEDRRLEEVRSPLILPMSTVSTVLGFTTVATSSDLLIDTTMAIIERNIISPLRTDTITTPMAEASMVAPKLNGCFISFNSF